MYTKIPLSILIIKIEVKGDKIIAYSLHFVVSVVTKVEDKSKQTSISSDI
jgi:hypothetical protein